MFSDVKVVSAVSKSRQLAHVNTVTTRTRGSNIKCYLCAKRAIELALFNSLLGLSERRRALRLATLIQERMGDGKEQEEMTNGTTQPGDDRICSIKAHLCVCEGGWGCEAKVLAVCNVLHKHITAKNAECGSGGGDQPGL